MSDLVDHEVCTVGVAVVVSDNVNVTSMSTDTLSKIFTGQITNWSNVPGYTGSAHAINVIYRKSGSGTRILFETYGLGLSTSQQTSFAYVTGATVANASTDVKADINSAAYSIGYETIPYTDGLKKLSIDFGNGAAACNYDNINNGTYKLWGYEHIYTKGKPISTTQAFIDYITSADAINTIKTNGYGLTTDLKSAAIALNH
jgi:phosphate transport system substrate-binding protein